MLRVGFEPSTAVYEQARIEWPLEICHVFFVGIHSNAVMAVTDVREM
jgi:hypothetical protein